MDNEAPHINVTQLSVAYRDQWVLKDVSMTVPGGRVLAVIGPSGCGKSTLLRVLNRLVDRASGVHIKGQVQVGNFEVIGDHVDLVELRQKVGMVFQHPNPFPFSVFDNVAYGLRLQGVKNSNRLRILVEESLKQASLWDEVRGKLRRPASSLSGGQQQRLCIARALAVSPQVLLMDEPTSALDPLSTAKIEELVLALKGQYTVILVTHNLQQAARVSDFTAFFREGRLVELGPTKEVFTTPRQSATEEFLTGRYE
ncbi:MAG: phosphate ABC transporter ATP-binding protein PstB [Firmicutes bacterium]|nr:phosphate ABC transporter ATP-binding protein PstB [Bacillota bacterium]MCL5972058.1 phosphate ABC transporter ATP-binding protein PstB [Bacillota bacterium]